MGNGLEYRLSYHAKNYKLVTDHLQYLIFYLSVKINFKILLTIFPQIKYFILIFKITNDLKF